MVFYLKSGFVREGCDLGRGPVLQQTPDPFATLSIAGLSAELSLLWCYQEVPC